MAIRILKFGLLTLCLFFLGMLAGIGVDWSTWRPWWRHQRVTYEVQPYGDANLLVSQGDKIKLVRPQQGGNPLKVRFPGGDSPCSKGNDTDECTIGKNVYGSAFSLECYSTNGQTETQECPDPEIEQRGTTHPFETLGFWKLVLIDVEHLFGRDTFATQTEIFESRVDSSSAGNTPTDQASSGPTSSTTTNRARVYCNRMDPNNPATWATTIVPIAPPDSTSVPAGGTFYWVPTSTLTIKFTASNPCASGPTAGPGTYVQCTTPGNAPVASYIYTAQLTGCGNDASGSLAVTATKPPRQLKK